MREDNTNEESDALAEMPEWTDDDWARAKPNRFAGAFADTVRVVLLDSDTSQVYHDSAQVNEALRALIQAMPASPKTKRVAKTTSGRADTISAAMK